MKLLMLSLIFHLTHANGLGPGESFCAPLRPGESLLVQEDQTESPTGLARLYEISKDDHDPNIYRIYVPIDLFIEDVEVAENQLGETSTHYLAPNDAFELFYPTAELSRELEKLTENTEILANRVALQHVQASLFQRARRCLENSHGRIVGPDGEDLRLFATTSTRLGIDAEGLNRIRVSPSPHRSTSINWAEDIDCHVIIHEVLHLLGLVDGYEEHEWDFTCRHIEPPTSAMATMNVLGPFYNYISCPQLDDQSLRPQLLRYEGEEPFNCFGENKSQIGTRQSMLDLRESSGSSVLYEERPQFHPILHRAHVRFITKPFCAEENEQYITCAQNAMRSEASGCIETPNYCSDGSYLNN